MASNKLRALPGVKRGADFILAPLALIEPDDGWNVRHEDDDLQAHIKRIAESILNGGTVPPLQVYERNGKLILVDGHCRTRAYQIAKENGADIDLVPIIEFVGDDADRLSFMFTSSQGKALTPYEQSVVFKRLQKFNWTTAAIALRVGRSVKFVNDMLKLANSDTEVKELVASGQVAVTAAVKVVKEAGAGAAAELREKIKKVNANVKEGEKPIRVTDRHVDTPGISKSLQLRVIEMFDNLPSLVGEEVYALALPNVGANANQLDEADIDVSLFAIVQLIQMQIEINREREDRING